MKKPRKKIPVFKTEADERKFWEMRDNDSTEYFDHSQSVRATFPNPKASTTAISLRLPDSLLAHIKTVAQPSGCAVSIADENVAVRKIGEC